MSSALPKLPTPGWLAEFRTFILRGSVVDLAVGIIVGVAFTAIVGSLVKDIFTPVIGLLVGGVDFTNLFVTLKGPHMATLAAAKAAGAVTVNFGIFLNEVVNFLIVAFAIFWVIKLLVRLRIHNVAAAGPTPTEVLLTEIRDLLKNKAE
jgi:large conductance mechanosensitive channel